MKTLITYDVTGAHGDIREALIDLGYETTIIGEKGKTCHLPNTTLWKNNINSVDAREEVRQVTDRVARNYTKGEIILERVFALEFRAWAALVGEPF